MNRMAATLLGVSISVFIFAKIAVAETITGMDAIEAVVGHPVVLNYPDGRYIITVESGFDFRLKRPQPFNDEIKGKISRGMDSSKVCFSYGGVLPASCVQLEYNKGLLSMIWHGGRTVRGKVKSDLPEVADAPRQTTSQKRSDQVICQTLLKIVTAAQSPTAFDKLVDTKRKPLNAEDDGGLEYYYSKVKFGDCLIDTTTTAPRHYCTLQVNEDDVKSVEFYKTLITEVPFCLGDNITSAKASKTIKKNATDQDTAASHYKIGEHIKLSIAIGPSGLCTRMPFNNCNEPYGIHIDTLITP